MGRGERAGQLAWIDMTPGKVVGKLKLIDEEEEWGKEKVMGCEARLLVAGYT